MDMSPQIQLPDPQQHIYNSQSFQQPSVSAGSSFFSRNTLFAGVLLMVVVGAGMWVMSVKKAADSVSKKLSKHSQEVSQLLDESNDPEAFALVGKVQANYDNPFDEKNSYENPFDDEQNPFGE